MLWVFCCTSKGSRHLDLMTSSRYGPYDGFDTLHLGTKPQPTSFCMSFVPNREHCHVGGCLMNLGLRPVATFVHDHMCHSAFLEVHRAGSSPVREGINQETHL